MKKIFVLFLVTSMFLTSCVKKSPKSVVEEFYTAIQNKDFDKAEALTSEETKSMISFLKTSSNFKVSGNSLLEKVDCITEDKKSECDCWFENSEKAITTVVILENEEWKVDAKGTLNKMMGDAFSGFKNIDLGGLINGIKDLNKNGEIEKMIDGFSKDLEDGTVNLNKIIEDIDLEKISESLNGVDTSLNKTLELLKEKGVDVKKALEELEQEKK